MPEKSKLWGDLGFILSIIVSLIIAVTSDSKIAMEIFRVLIIVEVLSWIFGWRRKEIIKLLKKVSPSQAKELESMDDLQRNKIVSKSAGKEVIFKPQISAIILMSFIFIIIPLALAIFAAIWMKTDISNQIIPKLALLVFALLILYFGYDNVIKKQGKVIGIAEDSIKFRSILSSNKLFDKVFYYKDIQSFNLIPEKAATPALSHNYKGIIVFNNKKFKFNLFLHSPSKIKEIVSLIKGKAKLKGKLQIGKF